LVGFFFSLCSFWVVVAFSSCSIWRCCGRCNTFFPQSLPTLLPSPSVPPCTCAPIAGLEGGSLAPLVRSQMLVRRNEFVCFLTHEGAPSSFLFFPFIFTQERTRPFYGCCTLVPFVNLLSKRSANPHALPPTVCLSTPVFGRQVPPFGAPPDLFHASIVSRI